MIRYEAFQTQVNAHTVWSIVCNCIILSFAHL